MHSSNTTLDAINEMKMKQLLAPIAYLAILMVVGVPGNSVVLLVYLNRYSTSVYRSIIWTLSLTDLLFCILALPFNLVRIVRYYTFYNVWICKCCATLILLIIVFSSHLLLILSIHRFKKVCMPHKPQIKTKHIRFWIAAGFVLAVLFVIPEFILQTVDEIDLGQNITGFVCAVSFSNSLYAEIYNGISTCLFAVYALVLLCIYLMIGHKMYLQSKLRRRVRTKGEDLSTKATKIGITVSAMFALSYLPLFILKLLVNEIDQDSLSTGWYSFLKIAERSYAINHVINPFIYAFFDGRFRFYVRNSFINDKQMLKVERSAYQAELTENAEKSMDSISLKTLQSF